MAFDAYLQIDGVKGESTDSEHKDWIEILSYSQPSTQPASPAAASKSTTRGTHEPYVIVKHVDIASPKLYELASTGRHISKVIIEVVRASGGKPVKYMTIKMNQVYLSNMSRTGSSSSSTTTLPKTSQLAMSTLPVQPALTTKATVAPALLTETLTFNYASVEWEYT